ncbi:MAG: peptidase M23 [Nevskiaceae bacterium]|nr:MAG: peptidase M23 [Nevskiaceae bacterium]
MTDWQRALAGAAVASPLPFELNARRCLRLDLGGGNAALNGIDATNPAAFSAWIARQIADAGADYAAGGYGEDRALYHMSPVFTPAQGETRTLHLGIDLWLPAGTPVCAVLGGTVHSTQNNAAFGDYGPTIILEHVIDGERFHTLHGHLAQPSLALTLPGQPVKAGQVIGWLGTPEENVGWPPHLHFQIIRDLQGRSGDYPGVCKASEKAQWLENCPDPNLLLRIDALND